MIAEAEIRRRIRERGPITFAEFMEVALYHPQGGYYTGPERVGVAGDFYTSPSVHPAFGALLAVQLCQMWQLLGRPSPFTVLEPGAGNGLLCRDIIVAARPSTSSGREVGLLDEFARSLRYVCLDRRDTAGHERGLPGVSRLTAAGLPFRGVVGCILSNELHDAMPVHQVTRADGRMREIMVTLDGGDLVTTLAEPSSPLLEQRLDNLGVTLEEGQTAEINLALEPWAEEAASCLERGFVLAIDYGLESSGLYSSAERFRGTLTTYHRHTQTDRPLERIGQQDMSAQVDFTSLARAGASAGLDVLGYGTQAAFLQNLGMGELLARRPVVSPRQAQAGRVGMRELVKPGGLGDFKVMAFGKGVLKPELWGFSASPQAKEMAANLPPLSLTPAHMDLLAGRYPSTEMEFDVAWDELWLGESLSDDSPSP